jgi:hypothetical protein
MSLTYYDNNNSSLAGILDTGDLREPITDDTLDMRAVTALDNIIKELITFHETKPGWSLGGTPLNLEYGETLLLKKKFENGNTVIVGITSPYFYFPSQRTMIYFDGKIKEDTGKMSVAQISQNGEKIFFTSSKMQTQDGALPLSVKGITSMYEVESMQTTLKELHQKCTTIFSLIEDIYEKSIEDITSNIITQG